MKITPDVSQEKNCLLHVMIESNLHAANSFNFILASIEFINIPYIFAFLLCVLRFGQIFYMNNLWQSLATWFQMTENNKTCTSLSSTNEF